MGAATLVRHHRWSTHVLLLAGTLALWQSPAAAVPIVYVDAAGSCDGNTPCYTTIQAGVRHVTEAPDMSAGQVRVFAGTYNESVDLSQMGMDVGGMPGNILVIREDLIAILAPASSGAVEDTPPANLPPELIERLMDAKTRFLELAGTIALPPLPPPNAATASGGVMSPAGPAIWNSVVPFPGDIDIDGIDVLSPNSDGIKLTAAGNIGIALVNASGNFGFGLNLSSMDDISIFFCVLDQNGGSGAAASAADDITVFNTAADLNKLHGLDLRAGVDLTVGRIPLPLLSPLPVGVPDRTEARGNTLNGIIATAMTGEAEVIDIGILITGLGSTPGINIDDNQNIGLSLAAAKNVSIAGVEANRNSAQGMSLSTPEQLLMILSFADQNGGNGIEVGNALTLLCEVVGANDNDLSGLVASTTGTADFGPFGMLGAFLLFTSTDGNKQNGTDLLTTGGPITMLASTAIGNTAIGVNLVPHMGTQNQVTGGVICSNGVGLALRTNSTVDAEGNWWGSTSGPFHATKNPTGTGNPVLDGTSGGGAGDVDFIPWIDTVTGTAVGMPIVGTASPVRFQFSGGNGTVFLGLPGPLLFAAPFGPGASAPFTVSTDNGRVSSELDTGESVPAFLNQPNGTVEVDLIASRRGPATVTIAGPCGLSGTLRVNVGGAQAAPLLSGFGLLGVFAALAAVAALALRRARRVAW